MHISINTGEPLSSLDQRMLSVLLDSEVVEAPAPRGLDRTRAEAAMKTESQEVTPAAKPVAKKAAAKKAVEPEPTPEPMAEEPLVEPEAEEEEEEEEQSDEELLALAVKKATEMVAGGQAAQVREALDATGVSRVRQLNKDNVRDFFKALS